ncbi:MAG: PfkB family carbohydrate kinase, partial [Dermatophilaceae bacterium]
DVVKCSSDDLLWLYPDRSPEQVMEQWSALGAPLVVVTLGPNGVTWRTADGRLGVDAARSRSVVDTVGAGDSFMAGLVSGLLDAGLLGSPDARARLRGAGHDDVAPAVGRALATSGVTVQRAGAYAPTRDEV